MNCEKLSCEFMSDETFIRIQEFKITILPKKNNSRPPIRWLENSVIELADAASLPFISNLLYPTLPNPESRIPNPQNI